MTAIAGVNPYTGEQLAAVAMASTPDEVGSAVTAAVSAENHLRIIGRAGRAELLRGIADNLELNSDELIAIADEETGIGGQRLAGELRRAVFQFRFFGDVLDEGSYLETAIDLPAETPMGPRPDLRRILQPVGPVAVFGASNFPFAFSVAGGDTASALAAGSPVVVKAHSSHPNTSRVSYMVMSAAAARCDAPNGILGIVYGQNAGLELVKHPGIQAVSFTGSLGGGQALMDAIGHRSKPVPFYGELSSTNPLIVTEAGAAERAHEIGAGFAASITTSAGQLCTKPGVAFIPVGNAGDRLVSSLMESLSTALVQPLLNRRILQSYEEITSTLASVPGVQKLGVPAESSKGGGFHVSPVAFSINASDLRGDTIRECFGPSTLIVRYEGMAELKDALEMVDDALTFSIQLGGSDLEKAQLLTELATAKAGRIVYNGFPTGVAVSWSQTHGGPWPATNSIHTSVGSTAIRRFLRPVTFQDAPPSVLPEELRDGPVSIPTRINGVLVLP
jgi:NADP-dependent aldehyde dehydrogenase